MQGYSPDRKSAGARAWEFPGSGFAQPWHDRVVQRDQGLDQPIVLLRAHGWVFEINIIQCAADAAGAAGRHLLFPGQFGAECLLDVVAFNLEKVIPPLGVRSRVVKFYSDPIILKVRNGVQPGTADANGEMVVSAGWWTLYGSERMVTGLQTLVKFLPVGPVESLCSVRHIWIF